MMFLAAAFSIVGSLAVGAWLVINGHPWFGLLVILLGACMRYSSERKE